jgi:hypothetical protein
MRVFRILPISNARLKSTVPRSGRILLDLACRNAYNLRRNSKGTSVRTVVAKSLILVVRRTAVGG